MKISMEWLREYVSLPESAETLKEDLTMIGLLVEGVEPSGGGGVLDIEVTSNRPEDRKSTRLNSSH
jgi:phenylalanyl-tRNA synthetase beta chain